ncbi:K02A2.6-like [Cordylochernes scorpioides]|uniref:RNA-directed DNA polymerase n=1 Tax=Cordylochernes scorpioides TaxID=51811 RepID=A0ABY6K3I4_9ARAC|nr:K02A2.6-like [Cordylochernes scorpioides]
MNFDYKIEYKKGRENVLPDYIFRSSLSSHDYDGEVELIASINQDMLAISEEEFLRECSLCPEIIALKEQLMKPWSNNESSQLNKYFRLRKDLSVQEDLILNEKEKILVPVSLRNKLLSFAHKAHQGMVRTKQRLRECYWWPGMDKDVEYLVTNCWVCKNHDKRLKSIRVPITPVERPENLWTKLGLDIVGPFIDTEIGFRFAITLIDYTSKWPEVFCTNKTTSKVIINFLEDVFSREGFPREIVTDNGTPFISEEFEDFLGSNGIKHIRTANYHPACNGEVENFNKTLQSTVLTAHLQHTEVKRTIQLFLREYRSTPHTVTKQTPSAVLHGRTLRTLVHVFDEEVKTKPPEEACRQEDKSDSESKSCSPKLQVGDQVKVQAGDPVMKGRSKLRGPFTITKQLRPFTFVLSDGKVWNARRLRLYQKCAGTYTHPDTRHELGIHPALHLDDHASQEESTPPPDSSPIASRLRSKCYRKGGRCDVVTSPDVT